MRWTCYAVLLAVLLCSHPAEAASRVVLIRPPAASELVREAVTRLRAELLVSGFEVVISDKDGHGRAALERAAKREQAIAAVAITPSPLGATADVWVADALTGKTLVRSVDVRRKGRQAASELAVRSVELLRASLIETTVGSEDQEPVPDDVRDWMSDSRMADRAPFEGVGVELGLALLTSFDGVGPAAGPRLRLSYGGPWGFSGRLCLTGPSFGATIDGPLGVASVRQELLTLELAFAPVLGGSRWVPLATAGLGAYHLAATGELAPPRSGKSGDVWAAATLFGAGLGFRATDRIMPVFDVQALLTLPRAVIAMDGQPIATAGRPSLLASLGVVVAF